MVPVAGGRPIAASVDVAVGDRDTSAGLLTQHDVLAADVRGRYMIQPNVIGARQGNRVASPNVSWVELPNGDVLYDHL